MSVALKPLSEAIETHVLAGWRVHAGDTLTGGMSPFCITWYMSFNSKSKGW